MITTSRTRFVNPRLGAYFGIFVSLLTGLVLLLMIFEQLGISEPMLRWVMLLGPLVLYCAIGLSVPSREALEFFASGRRVPAGYTGLGLASAAMGATGIVAMTGTFFLIGFDALCLVIGGLAGFVVMAVMLAPFLRKFGAFTVPSYLGRRFESKPVRILAAALLAVPLLLLLAAELGMGASAAAWLSGEPRGIMILLLVMAMIVTVVVGGMRSFNWSSSGQAIAALLALIVPVAIVAVMVTNFPLPQLTHGPLLRALVYNEASQGIPVVPAPRLQFMIPGEGFAAVAKRFTAPFGSVGPVAFVVAMLTVLTGVAASPWLLPRVTMTPGVYETRKSLGWATVFFGLTMLTAASVSVFMRDFIMDVVKDGSPARLPDWMQELVRLGFMQFDSTASPLTFTSFKLARDTVLLALPVAAGLPNVFAYFAAAGIVAAALVAATAATVALANVLDRGRRQRPLLGANAEIRAHPGRAHRHRRCRHARRRIHPAGADRSVASALVVLRYYWLDAVSGAGAVDLVEAHERVRCARWLGLRICGRRADDPRRRGAYHWTRRRACRHCRAAGERARGTAREPRHARPDPQHAGTRARDPHSRRRGGVRPRDAVDAPQEPRARLDLRLAPLAPALARA